MKSVFADTSYWIAALNPSDDLNEKARAVAVSLRPLHIVTTEMVLTELLNEFAQQGPVARTSVKNFVQRLITNKNTTIISQSTGQFHAALALYGERIDKEWGITDCASYLVMKTYNIVDALTYDRHFEQMGFKALLR